MSVEFIEGRWYKGNNNDTGIIYYIKVKYFENTQYFHKRIFYSDVIRDGIYSNINDYIANSIIENSFILLEDLSEIQEYLPEGHLDKFKKEWWEELKEGDYVVSLEDHCARSNNYIYKILKRLVNTITYLSHDGFRTSRALNEFRKATPEEAKLYEKYGKPVSIYIDNSPKSKLIQEAIERGFIKQNKFIDLVHGIEFEIIEEAFNNYNNDNQLYVKCYSNKNLNKFARIYLNGRWAEIISEVKPEKYSFNEGDLVVITELKGDTNWGNKSWWIDSEEIVKLGGEWWKDIKLENLNSFKSLAAISKKYPKGNAAWIDYVQKKPNFKMRHTTLEEIEYYNKVGIGANINDLKNQKSSSDIIFMDYVDLIKVNSKLKFIKENDCKETIPEKVIIKTNIKFI